MVIVPTQREARHRKTSDFSDWLRFADFFDDVGQAPTGVGYVRQVGQSINDEMRAHKEQ